MTSAPDDAYIQSLNRNYDARPDPSEGIASHDQKIRELDGQIADARAKRHNDPWLFDQRLEHLQRMRQARVLQRASLDFQRRNALTADDDSREGAFSSGAIWRNDQG